ncbi:indolepyruvate oxidoreductase subunit beta [Fundidesulfovibrio terrae]|uniref:indolepyruvate oxidoreductase subunit beta n=1 Tax=Fundidesulfovibrio terrae TaxID=2922866 RepID=UPI001FAF90F5|nr:indolepyruvate oxidoreductase subunit beta [Fundidesulfovibrio terrae]
MQRTRIFFTGVGGQGTLTATKLVSLTALDEGLPVTSGEIHGMAQRGGVVESTVLIGYLSPKITHGEADVLLGFELLETLRALCYVKPGGKLLSNSEALPPLSVATGKADYPSLESVRAKAQAVASQAWFLPCRTLAEKAGSAQSANTVLLGAACAAHALPFGMEALERSVRKYLKPALAEINLKALALGAEAVRG